MQEESSRNLLLPGLIQTGDWEKCMYLSNVVFLNACTVMVSVSQSLFAVHLGMGTCGTSVLTAVMSPLSNVGELISLGLWYTMYPESFGGGAFLVNVS